MLKQALELEQRPLVGLSKRKKTAAAEAQLLIIKRGE